MITPIFDITQNLDFVIVTLKVKYIKASTADWYADNNQFKFHCKPYFLKLTFPYPIVEDGRETAKYDLEKGEMVIHLPKLEKGRFFPNLDMLTTLLGHKRKIDLDDSNNNYNSNNSNNNYNSNNKILVANKKMKLDEKKMDQRIEEWFNTRLKNDIEEEDKDVDEENIEEEEIDWSLPQVAIEEKPEEVLLNKQYYGFNNFAHNFFEKIGTDLSEMIDNPDPDTLSLEGVKMKRSEQEYEAFDIAHYI